MNGLRADKQHQPKHARGYPEWLRQITRHKSIPYNALGAHLPCVWTCTAPKVKRDSSNGCTRRVPTGAAWCSTDADN